MAKEGVFFENLYKQTLKNIGYSAYGVSFLLEIFDLKFNGLKFLMYFFTNSSLSFFSLKFKIFIFLFCKFFYNLFFFLWFVFGLFKKI